MLCSLGCWWIHTIFIASRKDCSGFDLCCWDHPGPWHVESGKVSKKVSKLVNGKWPCFVSSGWQAHHHHHLLRLFFEWPFQRLKRWSSLQSSHLLLGIFLPSFLAVGAAGSMERSNSIELKLPGRESIVPVGWLRNNNQNNSSFDGECTCSDLWREFSTSNWGLQRL